MFFGSISRMKIFFISTFSLIIAGTDAVTTVTGYRGRSVQIKCPYTSGYEEHNKYLCRGECPYWPGSKDIPVQSGSPAKDFRFSLYDDTTAKVFTVTITDLRPEDAGTYWCVIKRTGCNVYTEILLMVKEDDLGIITHPTSTQARGLSLHAENTHSAIDVPCISGYVMISTGGVLFAIAVIIGIYCKVNYQGSGAVTQPFRETNEDSGSVFTLQATEIANLPESAYQNLDTSTSQSVSVYQSLIFPHIHPVSEYQSLTFTNNQTDLTYQSLIITNNQSDSAYQRLINTNNKRRSSFRVTSLSNPQLTTSTSD